MLQDFIITIILVLILIAPAIDYKSFKTKIKLTTMSTIIIGVLATDANGNTFLWTETPSWNETKQEFESTVNNNVGVIDYIGKYTDNQNYPKPKETRFVDIKISINKIYK